MRRLSNADGTTFPRFPSLSHFSFNSSDNDQLPSDEEELEVVLPSLHDVRFSWTQSKKKADAEAMFLWTDGFSSAEIYKSSTSIGGKTAKKRPQSAKSLGSKKSKNNLMKTLSAQLAMFGEQNLLKGEKSGGALSMDRSGIPFSRHTSDKLRQQQRSGNSRDRSSNSLPKSLKDGEAFPINDDNSPDTSRYPTNKKTANGTHQNNLNESMKEGSQIDNLLWLGDPDEVILAKCTMLLNTKTTATEKLPTMQSIQEFRPRRQSTVITVLEAVEAAKQGKKDFPSVPNLSTKVIIMRSLLFCLS